MNDEAIATDVLMRRRIDALVCGELAEEERAELLAWLDGDDGRWRQCALSFLEARVWEETLGSEAAACGQVVEAGSQRSAVRGRRSDAQARWLTPLALVAASVAAFACGMWWRGVSQPRQPGERIVKQAEEPRPPDDRPAPAGGPMLASIPVKAGPLENVDAVLQFPVLPPEEAKGPVASSISEHVRREWERRGYELKEERRYLPARLPDGGQVMVPVNEVKMKFVGRPVS